MASVMFRLRVPEEELARWKDAAGVRGVSAWLRELAARSLGEPPDEALPAPDPVFDQPFEVKVSQELYDRIVAEENAPPYVPVATANTSPLKYFGKPFTPDFKQPKKGKK
jgi:hypothetical protein